MMFIFLYQQPNIKAILKNLLNLIGGSNKRSFLLILRQNKTN